MLAEPLTGPATVTDGDTIQVQGERVRLWGIDAPEMNQVCHADGQPYQAGEMAAMAVTVVIDNDPVSCDVLDTDRYGRAVVRYSVEGNDLGSMMVAAGWAWDFTRYSDGFYEMEEASARQAGLGVWGGECMAPWEWRRR